MALWFFLVWEGRGGRGGSVAVMGAGVLRTVRPCINVYTIT